MQLSILACALAIGLMALSGSGHAVNWEGHTDWMADMPQALELMRQLEENAPPTAQPRPPSCPDDTATSSLAGSPAICPPPPKLEAP